MIEIKNVSFSYAGSHADISNVTFSIKPGECVLLCGESGCGKTTVTKLINGLIPYFTEGCTLNGSVTVQGLTVKDTELYQLAKCVGSVFQNPKSQFFHLDTDSELAFGLENQGLPPAVIRQRTEGTVQELRMENLMGRNIFSLSGGEKQTLAFASVYAMNPSIFVLDEPTANLDRESISHLREQILLLKERGHTVLVAEHRLYFLEGIIDRALYFQTGRLVQEFTGDEFWKLPEAMRMEMGLPHAYGKSAFFAAGTGMREGRRTACSKPYLRIFKRKAGFGRGIFLCGTGRGNCGYRSEWSGKDYADPLPLRADEAAGRKHCIIRRSPK